MKILVISDSHLNNDWTKIKVNYDLIIHAGDHQMSHEWMIKNTDYFVDGNNDYGTIDKEVFEIEGINFVLVHGDKYNVKQYEHVSPELLTLAQQHNAKILIFGHSHIPLLEEVDNIYFLNPGSTSKPRGNANIKTYAEIIIENKTIKSIDIKHF